MENNFVVKTINAKNGRVVEIYQISHSKDFWARLVANGVRYADNRNEGGDGTLWDALTWAKQYEVITN